MIRRARPEDAAALAAVHLRSALVAYAHIFPPEAPKPELAAVTALATVVPVPTSAPRRAMVCSSIGAPAALAPCANASLPESVTVAPGVSSCGWASRSPGAGAGGSAAVSGLSSSGSASLPLPFPNAGAEPSPPEEKLERPEDLVRVRGLTPDPSVDRGAR